MAGTNIGYLDYLVNSESTFTIPGLTILLVAGGALVVAVILELVRPFRFYPRQVVSRDVTAMSDEIMQKLKTNQPFVYWDSQNPLYMKVITIVLPVAMLVFAVVTWFGVWWVSLELLIIGILIVSFYGGMRTVVTRRDISVRFGLWGLRVLHIPLTDINSVTLHEFSPLKDFGGYGIRFNSQMKAYYMNGSVGILIATHQGKKYLVGSNHPENLLAATKTLLGQG